MMANLVEIAEVDVADVVAAKEETHPLEGYDQVYVAEAAAHPLEGHCQVNAVAAKEARLLEGQGQVDVAAAHLHLDVS